MKNLIRFLSVFLTIFFVFSCSDEPIFEEESKTISNIGHQQNSRESGDIPERTILGEIRTNPFTIEHMRQAWEELDDPDIPEPFVSNLYIKFSPSSLEQMGALSDLDEMLYDYPLEYEVLEMGEYYIEPDFENEVFPDYYAIVDPEFSFEGLQFEVLEELYVPDYDTRIVQKAFQITGNDYARYGVTDPYATTPDDEEDFPHDGGGMGGTPPSGGNGDYDDIFTTNACGCRVYTDSRKPGGCINVWDTQYAAFEGVRQVKVILKDTWFTEDEVWTSDGDSNGAGCFYINRRYSNKAWMWVKFRNHRTNIRGVRGANLWEYAMTVKDYVGVRFAPFNQLAVDYNPVFANDSRDRMHWYAATANNALHEYHDFAAEDGILPPSDHLDITVFNWNGTAAAPMLDDMWIDDVITLATANVILGFTGAVPVAGLELLSPGIVQLLVLYINWFAPDVAYFYGDDGLRNSDLVKETFYHEFAHASHFRNVGQNWWLNMIEATVLNGGWGDQNGFDAERISIAESWAGFLGRTYTHNSYPDFELATVPSEPSLTWEESLEQTLNWNSNHVPIGLHHDLIDGRRNEVEGSDNFDGTDFTIVNDQVEGFTIGQIFSSLNSNVSSVQEFESVLIADHLPSTTNSIIQVNNIFDQYGQ